MDVGGAGVTLQVCGYGSIEIRSAGVALQEDRCKNYGGLEVWKLDEGVATWRYGVSERWKRAIGVEAWRYGVWRSGGGLWVCRRGSMEVWSSGVLEVRYRRRGVEVWRYGNFESR